MRSRDGRVGEEGVELGDLFPGIQAIVALGNLIQVLGLIEAITEHRPEKLEEGFDLRCQRICAFCASEIEELQIFGQAFDDSPTDE